MSYTEDQYLSALKIVDSYRLQQTKEREQSTHDAKIKQQENEDNCLGHEYRPSGGKWTPINQRSCINCGKTLF